MKTLICIDKNLLIQQIATSICRHTHDDVLELSKLIADDVEAIAKLQISDEGTTLNF